jgi:hypothetical protein
MTNAKGQIPNKCPMTKPEFLVEVRGTICHWDFGIDLTLGFCHL